MPPAKRKPSTNGKGKTNGRAPSTALVPAVPAAVAEQPSGNGRHAPPDSQRPSIGDNYGRPMQGGNNLARPTIEITRDNMNWIPQGIATPERIEAIGLWWAEEAALKETPRAETLYLVLKSKVVSKVYKRPGMRLGLTDMMIGAGWLVAALGIVAFMVLAQTGDGSVPGVTP